MSIDDDSNDEELELMKQCFFKDPSEAAPVVVFESKHVSDTSPVSFASEVGELVQGRDQSLHKDIEHSPTGSDGVENADVDTGSPSSDEHSPSHSANRLMDGAEGVPAADPVATEPDATPVDPVLAENDSDDRGTVEEAEEADEGEAKGSDLGDAVGEESAVLVDADEGFYKVDESEPPSHAPPGLEEESAPSEVEASGSVKPVEPVRPPVGEPVRTVPPPPPRPPAPVFLRASELDVSKPQVRGRVFTEPAWKTAGLLQAKEAKEDLSYLEKKVMEFGSSISDLDNMIQSRLRDREMLQREIADLESRGKPTPQTITLPPWLRGASQNPSPVVSFSPTVQSVSSSQFIVECQRSSTEPLGLRLTFTQSTGQFIVDEVKDMGLVPMWNLTAKTPVCVGDTIVRVNNTSDPIKMKAEFGALNIRMTIERSSTPKVTSAMPPPPPKGALVNRAAWPQRSIEVYDEILHALGNRSSRDQPRTGIMSSDDVPIKLPDNPDGSFRCSLCRVVLRNEQEYTTHMRSQKHEHQKEQIDSRDFWTKCNAEKGQTYWYENTIGLWSIDDPGGAGTGSHTVIS